MCCGDSKLIKCSLTFFFLFFLLCGLGLLAVGIWVIEDFRFVAAAVTYPTAFFQHAAYIAIATGSCAIVAFTIGCYGAWTESKAVLTVFSATAVVILLVESASIVLAFVFGAHSGPLLAHGAASTLKYDYGTANSDGVAATSAWDYAQITFRCCGYNNGSDYQGSTYDASNSQPNPWPLSCCETTAEGTFADVSSCTNDAEPRGSYAGVGCAAAIEGHVRDYGVVIGAVAAGVVFIQLMTVVFACTLAGRRVSSPDVI